MHDFQAFLAPAKINLFLHITGQRADGYHTLQSVFCLLDFYDAVYLKSTHIGQIKRVKDISNLPESHDLCMRAAIALQQATGCKPGVEIALEKRIAGGLGGGSSNAATVLIALNHLWQTNLSREDLMAIGLTLGADVPVFIFGQTAWAEGVGEILSSVDLPQAYQDKYFVVVTPQVHVSSAQVFANTSLTKDTKPLKIADFSSGAFNERFTNDLEKIVCEDFPAVAATLNWLKPYGKARMSGSGASVFIAVDSMQIADELLAKLPANNTGFVAKRLIKHPHYHLIK